MREAKRSEKASGVPQRCPICGRIADPAARPFCSRRCADVDLARWFGEVYRVPAPDEEPDEDDLLGPARP